MAKISGVTSIDGDNPHGHQYEMDEWGNGQTVGMVGSNAVPHTHTIRNKKLNPSGFDNHTHHLGQSRAGALNEKIQ